MNSTTTPAEQSTPIGCGKTLQGGCILILVLLAIGCLIELVKDVAGKGDSETEAVRSAMQKSNAATLSKLASMTPTGAYEYGRTQMHEMFDRALVVFRNDLTPGSFLNQSRRAGGAVELTPTNFEQVMRSEFIDGIEESDQTSLREAARNAGVNQEVVEAYIRGASAGCVEVKESGHSNDRMGENAPQHSPASATRESSGSSSSNGIATARDMASQPVKPRENEFSPAPSPPSITDREPELSPRALAIAESQAELDEADEELKRVYNALLAKLAGKQKRFDSEGDRQRFGTYIDSVKRAQRLWLERRKVEEELEANSVAASGGHGGASLGLDRATELTRERIKELRAELTTLAHETTDSPAAPPPKALPVPSEALPEEYVYRNQRFGFSVTVPRKVFANVAEAPTGERATASTPDQRVKLLLIRKPALAPLRTVFAEWSAEHTAKDPGKTVDKRAFNDRERSFVVSGRDGTRGYYVKAIEASGSNFFMCVEYDRNFPVPLTEEMIAAMSSSFAAR